MGRPATGQDPHVSFRLPEARKAELTEHARREGISRSALLNRIVARYLDSYPLDDD